MNTEDELFEQLDDIEGNALMSTALDKVSKWYGADKLGAFTAAMDKVLEQSSQNCTTFNEGLAFGFTSAAMGSLDNREAIVLQADLLALALRTMGCNTVLREDVATHYRGVLAGFDEFTKAMA